jgi:hypothetical protein
MRSTGENSLRAKAILENAVTLPAQVVERESTPVLTGFPTLLPAAVKPSDSAHFLLPVRQDRSGKNRAEMRIASTTTPLRGSQRRPTKDKKWTAIAVSRRPWPRCSWRAESAFHTAQGSGFTNHLSFGFPLFTPRGVCCLQADMQGGSADEEERCN